MKLKSEAYEIKDDKLERKKVTCPRCGEGVYLAEHKGRKHCGKCGYTKWNQ